MKLWLILALAVVAVVVLFAVACLMRGRDSQTGGEYQSWRASHETRVYH